MFLDQGMRESESRWCRAPHHLQRGTLPPQTAPASQRPLRVSCELEFTCILGNPGSQLDRGRGLVASPTWVPPVGVSFSKRTTHSQLFALRFNVLQIFQEVSHCFVCQTRAASFGIFQKDQDTCFHIPSQRLTFPKGSIPSSRSPGKPNPGVLSTLAPS